MKYTFLILPLFAFSKHNDGKREITFGWFTKTWYLKY
jgi:hypothetical protein